MQVWQPLQTSGIIYKSGKIYTSGIIYKAGKIYTSGIIYKSFYKFWGYLTILTSSTSPATTPNLPTLFFLVFLKYFFGVPHLATFISFFNVTLTPSSIRRRDSNPQPLSCKSSPLTTRPRLSPYLPTLFLKTIATYIELDRNTTHCLKHPK